MNTKAIASILRDTYCTEDMILDNKNRFSDGYICTVPATENAEAVEKEIREYISHLNKITKVDNPNVRRMRVAARGRGTNRLERVKASDNAATVESYSRYCEGGAKRKANQDLPRSVADTLDLYLYIV